MDGIYIGAATFRKFICHTFQWLLLLLETVRLLITAHGALGSLGLITFLFQLLSYLSPAFAVFQSHLPFFLVHEPTKLNVFSLTYSDPRSLYVCFLVIRLSSYATLQRSLSWPLNQLSTSHYSLSHHPISFFHITFHNLKLFTYFFTHLFSISHPHSPLEGKLFENRDLASDSPLSLEPRKMRPHNLILVLS